MKPAIEPYATGLLDVGDGNHVYWEACGNESGKPVVVLHGGPGSGCTADMRRYFDADAYRIILFDQRNCGRSRPHASDPATDLSTNTTHHLVRDIELLRRFLGVKRWLVWGVSWGCTLALAYAEQHPECVSELILVGPTMTRQREIDWLYEGVAPLFPAQWARFCAAAGGVGSARTLIDRYALLLADSDAAVRHAAARAWTDWELALSSIDSDPKPTGRWLDPEFVYARARIVTHYFRNAAWLEDDVLLRNADRLARVPGVLIQGRLDVQAPLVTAWELSQAWPAADLVIVGGAGHSTSDAGMAEAIVAATDRFAASA